jgi:hypothetical protein
VLAVSRARPRCFSSLVTVLPTSTRRIGNFRAWKNHDPYQKSFERLLRDLKA